MMTLLKELFEAANEPTLWEVQYSYKSDSGRRGNGTYLVNAADNATAKSIIRELSDKKDLGYKAIKARTVKAAAAYYEQPVEEFIGKAKKPKLGGYTHLESGF
jgi:hypothetical protein